VKHVFPIDLGQWPQACCLITDKRAYGRFMRDHGIGEARPFPPEGGGSCQTITKGECCKVIIAIGPHPDWDELAVTLSHEATSFAMRWILEHVGENGARRRDRKPISSATSFAKRSKSRENSR
jgi:hypothetical protein